MALERNGSASTVSREKNIILYILVGSYNFSFFLSFFLNTSVMVHNGGVILFLQWSL